MEPVTVTLEGTSKILGLGYTKIHQLIGEGRLTKIKIGRRTLITTASIRALVGPS